MKRILGIAACFGCMFAWAAVAADEVRVEGLKVSRHTASGLTVVGGQVTLPGKGVWEVTDPSSEKGALTEILLEAPEAVYEATLGQRGQALQQDRRGRQHQGALRAPYWPLARWARTHAGRMPTVAELNNNQKSSVKRAFASLPVPPGNLLNPPAAPHAALVPGTVFEFETPRHSGRDYVRGTNTAPILVELHPMLDDGKHYVLRANARLERVEIDTKLMQALGVTVTPLQLDPAAGQYPESANYRLVAQQRMPVDARFSVSNGLTGATMELLCPAATGAPDGGAELMKDWAQGRADTWGFMAESYDAPGVRTWAWLQKAMLGGKQPTPEQVRRNRRNERNRRNRGATTDMMGVLGGRAALRETLQLEALRSSDAADPQTVPIETIKGVEVKSHPFEEMLAGEKGGRYPIADYVPHDRFFVGISKPVSLLPILDDGAAFLARVGAGATGRALRYDLKERYMQALGVNDTLVRTLLKNGAIQELAFFSPDLFFADGTEVTVIVRMNGTAGIKVLLKLLGISLREGAAPNVVKTPDGGHAYWGLSDDLIVMGTCESEVASVLALARKEGEGSLGQSAEFRYMLTRVPRTEQTRAYVYFSDPFIRRLVGPEVKIGQVRRLREKAQMQTVAYAAMLRAHDGFGQTESVDDLVGAGYLAKINAPAGVKLGPRGVPVSSTYGPLSQTAAITAADLSSASTNEVAAYRAYKENYSRYWRRFFDPIAMRIDEDGDELVSTTYILPLLDNSLYDGVREVVNADPNVPLRIPRLDPRPTGMLSLNLSEKAWREMLRDGLFTMARQMGIEGNALDQLGPAFHFAVFDSEPIIAFGSRSLLGMGGNFGDFDDEMMIPLFVSLLTRPCAMLVELQDPEPVRTLFRNGDLLNAFARMDDDVKISSYRVAGRDSWVAGLDAWGLSLRFSFAVEGKYLIISNMPWREPIHVASEIDALVSGASVQVTPSAAKIEMRALHLSALEGQREAVMEGLAYLYPLLASGTKPDAALQRHREIFGFSPVLPGNARIDWDGSVPGADGFGNLFAQEQPPFDPEAVFGALQGVGNASASMQFEATGLRTIVRWRLNKTAP
jgi:hypothetical protein